jgi:hypothetical protein
MGIVILGMSSPSIAKTKDLFPDFYFDTTYGFTTSKSKLVASNDLGSTFSYSLGSYAGKEAVLGFNLGFSTDTSCLRIKHEFDRTLAGRRPLFTTGWGRFT